MTKEGGSFDCWLSGRLDLAGVDGEVFSSYISGTLSSMDGASDSEVGESLLEILQGCLEDEATSMSICEDIQKHWAEETARRQEATKGQEVIVPAAVCGDMETHLPISKGSDDAQGMGEKEVNLSSEEKRKLLEQYGCESDDEDFSEEAMGGVKGAFVNQNTSVVGDAQKLHRELLKANHEAKIERDRRDKEAQKQRVLDRKEKEKKRTQKQERRR